MTIEERHQLIQEYLKENRVTDKSVLVDILDQMFPQISRGGHRAFINRKYGDQDTRDSYYEPKKPEPLKKQAETDVIYRADPEEIKTCPRCEKSGPLEEAFGWRYGTNSRGQRVARAQSWCRSCR